MSSYQFEPEADLSRYKIGLAERYERFRQTQLGDWMLYPVGKQGRCWSSMPA